MSSIDEAAALEQVVQALVARFASVDATTVHSVVDEVYRSFDGPVRDYVPLLVERVSRDRLRELVAEGASAPSVGTSSSTDSPDPVHHGRRDAVLA